MANGSSSSQCVAPRRQGEAELIGYNGAYASGTLLNPPRHEAWRAMHRDRRYARHLTQTELNQRFRDIFINLLSLKTDGKISVLSNLDEMARWTELFTHMLEEFEIRHGPFPGGFTRDVLHSETFPDFVGALADRAVAVLAARHVSPENAFIKFGKRRHMEALYERGAIRIQPASFYATPSHNGAVRDDELALGLSFALSRDDIAALVKNPKDVPANAPDQRVNVQFSSPGDCSLYCVSTALDPRLFVDFEAEACVIIRDQAAFKNRLT
jgi:hypothetical protein